MGSRWIRLITWLPVALLLAACSVHPLDRNPQPTVLGPADFVSQPQGDTFLPEDKWWSKFARPELDALIERGLQDNQDVLQAMARVAALEAVAKQTRSGLWPALNVEGDSQNEWEGSDEMGWESGVGAALSWELDVFKRIGSAALADDLQAQAAVAAAATVRLVLSAEIARAYAGAVAAQEKIQLLNEQLETDKKLLELIELRLEKGVGTNVEVLQQKSRVADSKSLIPEAEIDRRVFENRLDVLVGEMPDGVSRVPTDETLEFAATLPAVGVPADLLLNRPDLRAARLQLIASDADIAVAIANRLPRITLRGGYSFADTQSYNGPLAAIVGGFVQPLLDWGQRKYAVEQARAVYQQRLAAFTQNYLQAVESVENALYQENRQREFIRRLDRRIAILRETVQESEARYRQGIDTYLPALNALQELREVERDLVEEQLNLIQFRIDLHRAVGGPIPSETVIEN